MHKKQKVSNFTNRLKFIIVPALNIFKDVIQGYNHKEFSNNELISYNIREKGNNLYRNRLKFLREKKSNVFQYVYEKKIVYNIVVDPDCDCPDCTNCSCFCFLDKAVCKHIALVCYFKKHNFPDLIFSKKFSVRNTHRGRPKKASPALNLSE